MKKPNILFLMSDHLRADVLRPGCPAVTPTMDKLVETGVRFDRAYTPNAICSPARASLMTGLLPHNHGVLTVTHCVDDDQSCLREKHPHWAQSLRAAGYRTGYFGKWHVERSGDGGQRLQKFGWDVSRVGDTKMTATPTWSREFFLKNDGYADHRFYGVHDVPSSARAMGKITSFAGEFLDGALGRDEPWCCFVSFPEPHDPYYCSKELFDAIPADSVRLPGNYRDGMRDKPNMYRKAAKVFSSMSEEEVRFARRCYYGCVSEIDRCYGALREKLRSSGALEDTIVVLTTDHGDCLGAHGLFSKNVGAFEEVYNIPLVISGPGIAQGRVSRARVGTHDVCQTLLELAGCPVLENQDSRSFADECHLPASAEGRFRCGYAEFFGTRMPFGQRIVYKDQWKFVHNAFDVDELYDLSKDPHEMENLAETPSFAAVVADMCAVMWEYVRRTGDHTLLNTQYPPLRLAPVGPLAK